MIGSAGLKNMAATTNAAMIASVPSNRPASAMAAMPPTDATTSVAFSACNRSAWWLATGTTTMRTIIGSAMAMPIVRASKPRASSQSGKNGSWMPPNRK